MHTGDRRGLSAKRFRPPVVKSSAIALAAGDIHRNPPRLIARELCGTLRDGALRAHGAIGREQFAAVGLTRIEADTVSSWDYNCRKSRLEQLRSLRLQC